MALIYGCEMRGEGRGRDSFNALLGSKASAKREARAV